MDMSRRKFVEFCGLGVLSVAGTSVLAGCDGGKKGDDSGKENSAGGAVANKDKPVVFFNRQPSNSSTGELDMTTLNFNKDTYYVGFDANQGAEEQGKMVLEYVKKNAAKLDHNNDGTIGYVLAIGDIGHNDSIARTRGVRKALGTAVEKDGKIVSDPVGKNLDGSATVVQDGKLEADGKTYVIRELASQEMKNSAGATWDAATAGNAISAWAADFGDQIDVVVSNNDGMGMAMFNAYSKKEGLPTFGYDANSDAVAAIADGFTGTISQHPAGNVLSEKDYKYSADERSYYALNVAVTGENYKDFMDATTTYPDASKQLDASKSPEKKVWLNIYNSADNFLSSTYQPLLQKYDKLLNLKVEYIGGDGQTEANITNRLGNPSEYDAFAINMVKTDNGSSYTQLLQN